MYPRPKIVTCDIIPAPETRLVAREDIPRQEKAPSLAIDPGYSFARRDISA
jgi:hypothetical protein